MTTEAAAAPATEADQTVGVSAPVGVPWSREKCRAYERQRRARLVDPSRLRTCPACRGQFVYALGSARATCSTVCSNVMAARKRAA